MDDAQFPIEPGDYKLLIFREHVVSDSYGDKRRKADNLGARLSNGWHCYSTQQQHIMQKWLK